MAQWDDGYVTDVAYTSNFYWGAAGAACSVTAIRCNDAARRYAW